MAKADDVELPERDFSYVAGNKDRPWQQFTGRWEAIKPELEQMLARCSKDRPLRVVDLGACFGFFSLKAAWRHPEADVVAVEGSVGIGNGTAGAQGNVRQILQTEAVQTNLRWIQQLRLTNCFVAPEVWDYSHICEMVATGRPICDAMFMLSVVHHIYNVSEEQFARAGLSRAEGGIDLLAKLLMLSPRHFVELPNQPWMQEVYDKYGSARAILEAATKATGLRWAFKGPIYSAEWWGIRDTWILEVQDSVPDVDIQSCPFPLLYRGDEDDLASIDGDIASDEALDPWANIAGHDDISLGMKLEDDYIHPLDGVKAFGGALADPDLGMVTACQNFPGTLLDPSLYALQSKGQQPVREEVGLALKAATPALLLAHLTLREAVGEAEDLLREVRKMK
eukprot:TRINITY_DN64662_c0_g1_i1.p1 TRINITY_DN64662_c0_g1~~TRINITY_DN64662_c0_g1_i1.p1  ORF type:complete len:408 (+),score=86.50 TRINITY_DN64662_c0_g1_i1:41-1225(+)